MALDPVVSDKIIFLCFMALDHPILGPILGPIPNAKKYIFFPIDSFHIVISLSNRSSIEKSIKLFLKMKGQIAY